MTYESERICPRCDKRWTRQVIDPTTDEIRVDPCPTCRAFVAAETRQLRAQALADGPQGDWVAEGLCREVDPELWYPNKGDNPREAKAICARCPVKEPCGEWALRTREQYGVWGGMSERERYKLLQARRAA